MEKDFVRCEADVFLVIADLKVYSLEALLKVAYWYTGRCYLYLQFATTDTVEVRLKCRPGSPVNDLAEQFMNDLLDQTLRERIGKETEAFKNLILAHALSKTCLIRPEFETAEDDPQRISEPDDAKASHL